MSNYKYFICTRNIRKNNVTFDKRAKIINSFINYYFSFGGAFKFFY